MSKTMKMDILPPGKGQTRVNHAHPLPDDPVDLIARAREVALDILKPSPRELEHGLELHRESLVLESYSLGLRAPVDPAALNAAVESGIPEAEYLELFEEQSMAGWVFEKHLREEYRQLWEASGLTCMFVNAGEEGNHLHKLIKRLAHHVFLTDKMPELLNRVTSAEEIETTWREGKRALCLTMNGVPLSGNQIRVEEELRNIRVFAQLGVKMMHLTYNRRNLIGDGCGEPTDAGLSSFGYRVVEEMNRAGIIIDLAHTGWRTCIDAARASQQPVVVSHSVVHALNPHIRGKPDDVIRAVVDTGGTMGITNIPFFLGGKGDITTLLDHIDYVVQRFGVDSVTIGTDRPFHSRWYIQNQQKLLRQPHWGRGWEALWPEGTRHQSIVWDENAKLSTIWTNWPLFTVGLVQRGYRDEEIRKIIGGNLLRVAREVWK